ncbi:RPA family protein [Halobacterium salinarum]|jgi:RPA family protein|uniref:RPA family protein n=1 Tax=Halobacterium salinarum TaxID=2242 RepID=UPI00255566D8|nr:RPA family protein [Halobacterium salinarum]MDL0135811.1 RPA family protein [Halobacterium salinarum]MDL0139910.1 RPA family protein [Halobacterium salinarum]
MREVAQRAFAAEFNDATHTFRESDDDRAPVYALLPTGAKANRVFIVGTLTETTDVGSDDEYWQGRIVDPTGTVFVYAGQYQPDAAGMLRETEPPVFVAVVGKPRTYETDDGTVNVSLRPEHLTIVDEPTRNRWVTETATRTLERIEQFDDETNEYAQLAHEQYGDTVEQYRQGVITAVESLDAAPADAPTDTTTVSAANASEIVDDDGPGSTTSIGETSAAGDHEPTDQDNSPESDDARDDFDAGEFESER